jgi:DeoR/GlpR family transcriptional regulator of sugar metabolism
MYPEERQKKLLEIIKNNKNITVDKISKKFGTSIPTIYRDLGILERKNKIKKSYGCFELNENEFEYNYYKRSRINLKEKKAIGKAALKLIKEGETIILDESTTVHYLASELKEADIKITIITNSILVISLFINSKNINVISTGGLINKEIAGMSGTIAESTINNLVSDKFFFSSAGISKDIGVIDACIPDNIIIKKMFANISSESICLVDSTKFNNRGTVNWINLEKIKCLITDENIDRIILNELKEKNIDIIIAKL